MYLTGTFKNIIILSYEKYKYNILQSLFIYSNNDNEDRVFLRRTIIVVLTFSRIV